MSKDIVELNNTINQLGLIDLYKILLPTSTKCLLFSSALETFTKIDCTMGHTKQNLTNLKELKP